MSSTRQLVKSSLSLYLLILLLLFNMSYAQRIVTIGNSATSIVEALGQEKSIVATDTESVNLLKKQHLQPKDIGYKRALTIESIIAQSPSIVIADSSSGPASVVDRLANFNIKVVRLDNVTNESEVKENINKVARALGQINQSQQVTKENTQAIAKAQKIINGKTQLKVLVLLQISANSAYLLGQDTQANQWLKLLNAENILTFSGMRPASKEGLLTLKPDVVILAKADVRMSIPYTKEINYLKQQQHSRLVIIPAVMLEQFGAQYGHTLLALSQKLYVQKS